LERKYFYVGLRCCSLGEYMSRAVEVLDLWDSHARVRVRYVFDLSKDWRVRDLKRSIESLEKELKRIVRDSLARYPLKLVVAMALGKDIVKFGTPSIEKVSTQFIELKSGLLGRKIVLPLDVDEAVKLFERAKEKLERRAKELEEEIRRLENELKELQARRKRARGLLGALSTLVEVGREALLKKRLDELKRELEIVKRILEEAKKTKEEDVKKALGKLRSVVGKYLRVLEEKKKDLYSLIQQLREEIADKLPHELKVPGHGELELASLYEKDTKLVAEYIGTLKLHRSFPSRVAVQEYLLRTIPSRPVMVITI